MRTKRPGCWCNLTGSGSITIPRSRKRMFLWICWARNLHSEDDWISLLLTAKLWVRFSLVAWNHWDALRGLNCWKSNEKSTQIKTTELVNNAWINRQCCGNYSHCRLEGGLRPSLDRERFSLWRRNLQGHVCWGSAVAWSSPERQPSCLHHKPTGGQFWERRVCWFQCVSAHNSWCISGGDLVRDPGQRTLTLELQVKINSESWHAISSLCFINTWGCNKRLFKNIYNNIWYLISVKHRACNFCREASKIWFV